MNNNELVVSGLGVVIVILFAVLVWKFSQHCKPSTLIPKCPNCRECPKCPACPVVPASICAKVPIVNNFPSQSGSFYIQSKATNLYLKSDATMGSSKDATLFTWIKDTNELSPKINGYTFQLNFTNAGIVLNLSGYSGTTLALANTTGADDTVPVLSDKAETIGLDVKDIQNVGNINMQNFYGNLVVFA
jgi:hypothetical protein